MLAARGAAARTTISIAATTATMRGRRPMIGSFSIGVMVARHSPSSEGELPDRFKVGVAHAWPQGRQGPALGAKPWPLHVRPE